MPSLYDALSCKSTSSARELKLAYRRALLLSHPDKAHAADSRLFQKVVQAWAVLRDPASRRAYDCWLREQELRRRCCLNSGECEITKLLDESAGRKTLSVDCNCGGSYLLSLADQQYGYDFVCVPCSNCSLCFHFHA
uniref:J domain-containing protein n=1 Tax=Trichuris muris TaxID=70415 RepID=A0A5S6QSH2_TRIMR